MVWRLIFVSDVNEKLFGGYQLQVDMDPPSTTWSTYDVSFDIDENAALTFKKEQPVQFTGKIKIILNILGSATVTLENVRIIDTR